MKINQIIFILLIIPYLAYSQVNENTFDNAALIQLKNKTYGSIIYQIILVNNDICENRKYLINQNSKTISTILIPSEQACSDISGLALNGIREDKKGFQVSIEYGSRFFYNKIFYFIYYNNSFYLYQIKTKSFDKANPDIWKTKIKAINPRIKVSTLNLEKFLTLDDMGLVPFQ